jgi:glycosyltransferase involved in cell wall biosynthesis
VRILYHGSIVPERLPVSMLYAMRMLPEHVTLTAIGYETLGSLGYVAALNQRAAELGIAGRFRYLGSMDRFELMKACRSWDVGLALMPLATEERNFHTMVGASNKPFDYLTGGLALLVSDLPEWQEAFVRSGYGIACNPDDPQSIAAALRRLSENPAEMRAMGERGRRRILSEWNYETQFRPVEELLTNGAAVN